MARMMFWGVRPGMRLMTSCGQRAATGERLDTLSRHMCRHVRMQRLRTDADMLGGALPDEWRPALAAMASQPEAPTQHRWNALACSSGTLAMFG